MILLPIYLLYSITTLFSMISVVLAVFIKRSSSKRQHEFRQLRNKKIYPIKLERREELPENKWNKVNRGT